MKLLSLNVSALFACCMTLSACSQATELSRFQYTPNAGVIRDHGSASPLSYSVLYSFGEPNQGYKPRAGLINAGGTLYGTTRYGGAYTCGSLGCGAFFSITTSGTEKVLHSFGQGTDDGSQPIASVIYVAGKFYGTTSEGGKYGGGTVFVYTKGTENVLWSFGNGSDGKLPYAALINVGGTLYGTTYYGGKYGDGAVFSITTSGTENVLYSFHGPPDDGDDPAAGLLDVKGMLYGTTYYGGKYCTGAHGCGTVFSVPTTTSSTDNVLWSFGNGSDGYHPWADLINVGGTLYGTTQYGGAYTCGSISCGTVFSITTGGAEKVVHSFHGPLDDGSNPIASLLDVGGTLYGTTQVGGENNAGTVFKIPEFGTEKVLHSFGNGTAGAQLPAAGLIDVKGTLYGTTVAGGQFGDGTVYTQSP